LREVKLTRVSSPWVVGDDPSVGSGPIPWGYLPVGWTAERSETVGGNFDRRGRDCRGGGSDSLMLNPALCSAVDLASGEGRPPAGDRHSEVLGTWNMAVGKLQQS
jgi:hypothetical protein